ncbi:hypothetical protein [Geobacter sp.]|uniref:hypothetical protein n=1 Tax=Geobacter sp. TaxID=46610 RepID=UPI0027B95511|nr:hypothetical protein [Geobacter sp.]
MGLQDRVRELLEQEEPQKSAEEAAMALASADEEITRFVRAIDELEKVIFRYTAFTDKLEADKKGLERLAKEVEGQRLDVGKMLVTLEAASKSLPAAIATAIEGSVNRSIGATSKQIDAIREATREATQTALNAGAKGVEAAARKAEESAAQMLKAKRHMNWQGVALHLVGYPLAAILVAWLFVGNPKGHNSSEQKWLQNGKALETAWPKLSARTREEIQRVAAGK